MWPVCRPDADCRAGRVSGGSDLPAALLLSFRLLQWRRVTTVLQYEALIEQDSLRPNASNNLIRLSYESRPSSSAGSGRQKALLFSPCDVTKGFDSSLEQATCCQPVLSVTFAGCLVFIPLPKVMEGETSCISIFFFYVEKKTPLSTLIFSIKHFDTGASKYSSLFRPTNISCQ